jgi:hypothetical protein
MHNKNLFLVVLSTILLTLCGVAILYVAYDHLGRGSDIKPVSPTATVSATPQASLSATPSTTPTASVSATPKATKLDTLSR